MPRHFSLRLLGSPALESEGRHVSFARHKSMALLAYLALEPRAHARDSLATLLWPECGQSRARANLRSCLFELGHELGDGVLFAMGDTVELDRSAVTTDARQFLEEAALPPERYRDEADEAVVSRLEQATVSVGDRFMSGFTLPDCPEYDEWQLVWRSRIEDALAAALETLATARERRGERDSAIERLRRWCVVEPFEEEPRRRLMRLLAEADRWGQAADCYRSCVKMAREELGREPERATVELFDLLRASRRVAAPVKTMIGREKELAELCSALLDEKGKIHSLTGPGGIGKTRLALAVIEAIKDRLPGGAYFVDFASVREPDKTLGAIAMSLGLAERVTDEDGVLRNLEVAFRGRKALLVLDNFEQVLGASSIVARLDERCSGLEILVTSRERLGLEAEIEHRLPFLGVPSNPDGLVPGMIEDYAALRLLVDRTVGLNPAFAVTAGNCASLGRICVHLDGLPLAIELAAARLSFLEPEELVARLAKKFEVLTNREDGAPCRPRARLRLRRARHSRARRPRLSGREEPRRQERNRGEDALQASRVYPRFRRGETRGLPMEGRGRGRARRAFSRGRPRFARRSFRCRATRNSRSPIARQRQLPGRDLPL